MRVAVTGASGFVGRHVVAELLARGHHVSALVRRPAAADLLPTRTSVRIVVGDALDGSSPADLLDGADACIHLIGLIRDRPDGLTLRRAHVDATRALVDAARAADARRFVHMSALGVGGEGACEYQRTKLEGEHLVRDSALDWTIFRPGIIHGPEGEFVRLVARWVTGEHFPWTWIPFFVRATPDPSVPFGPPIVHEPLVQPVSVLDVAWCFAQALERSASIGEIYPLVGPDRMTMPDMLRAFRDALPRGNPALEPRGIPSQWAVRLARLARLAGLAPLLPFDEGMPVMGAMDAVASTDKPEAHLGFRPRPFRIALDAYADRVASTP